MSNWISYSPSSGTGDGTICVSSSANTGATSGECRSDYIVVYNRDYGVENKVNVLQYPQNPNLTISPGLPQHIRISPSGGTATISVSSNINWATEVFWDEYPEFLTATPSTGFGNGTITV